MSNDHDAQALARRATLSQMESSIYYEINVERALGIHRNRDLVEEMRSVLQDLKGAVAAMDFDPASFPVQIYQYPDYPRCRPRRVLSGRRDLNGIVGGLLRELHDYLSDLRSGLAHYDVKFDEIYPGHIPFEDLLSPNRMTRINVVQDRLNFWQNMLFYSELTMRLNGLGRLV